MPPTDNKGVLSLLLLFLAAILVGGGLWYWMSSKDVSPNSGMSPTPTPQNDDIQDLNELEADLEVDSEFQEIDEGLNSL